MPNPTPSTPALPEPVAWAAVHREHGDLQDLLHMESTPVRRWQKRVALHSATQLHAHAEAVAAVRVREALEEAAERTRRLMPYPSGMDSRAEALVAEAMVKALRIVESDLRARAARVGEGS